MRKTILAAALAALPAIALAQSGQGAAEPRITLYELPAFLGRSVTITSETPDLATVQFAKRAQSARVVGEWTVCPEARFQGACAALNADAPLLRRATVASLRPAAAAAAAAQASVAVDLDSLDADQGVEGQDVAFFARPALGGTQVSAGSNDRAAGDAFCRQAGYASSYYAGRARTQVSNIIDVSARGRVRAFPLRDVLCRK